MKRSDNSEEIVDVNRIFLDLENPRHNPYQSEDEVIHYLCSREYVLPLAKDIVKHGLNPLERFALIRQGAGKRTSRPKYVVAEGNRRLCALKLLHDPDLAPANIRKEFQKLSQKWSPVLKVPAIVYSSKEDFKLWLDRIHGDLQGGIGRKKWDAEQKARHTGSNKNAVAQAVLDYAEREGFISPDDRKGKLTTVQRYTTNQVFREAIGIDSSNPDDISFTRSKKDFDLLMEKFIADLIDGVVNSRCNSPEIIEYSRKLTGGVKISGERIEPQSMSPSANASTKKGKSRPKPPQKPSRLPYDEALHHALQNIPSFKLERLYYSICDISISSHTPLLAVGLWSFVESLTALHGRNGMDFVAYMNNDRLTKMGVTDKEDKKAIRGALQRISDAGNNTKHHRDAAAFNGDQLVNDLGVVTGVLSKLVDEVKL